MANSGGCLVTVLSKRIHSRHQSLPMPNTLNDSNRTRSAPPKRRASDKVVPLKKEKETALAIEIDLKVPTTDVSSWNTHRYTTDKEIHLMKTPSGVMMTRLELCKILGDLLSTKFCANNQVQLWSPDGLSPNDALQFQSSSSCPDLTPTQYLERIAQYSYASGEAILIGVWRILLLHQKWPTFPINLLTIYRLLLVGVMTSAKFFDDLFFSNGAFAMIGGLSVTEVNALEIVWLKLFDFNVGFTTHEYTMAYQTLVVIMSQEAASAPVSPPSPLVTTPPSAPAPAPCPQHTTNKLDLSGHLVFQPQMSIVH